jgi:glutamyl-tRNA synthetase
MHIGGLRSALFNYLYARHTDGSFILRVEDTDRERLVPEAMAHLTDSLNWLSLDPDEGPDRPDPAYEPYIQSERLALYAEYASQLLQKGAAYKDFTPPERLATLRQEAQTAKRPFRFTKELAQLESVHPDDRFVIRFQIQPGDDVSWDDAVWGPQRWQRAVLDDFVAIKSDGFPTYNFANVIDDHLMAISHVFRGSEFLATTPKNLLVYEAFGWQPPVFVHLPQVLGSDKAKLSKRHGAKSALEYRDAGYLPEAVLNFLASLGFNDGTTQELYSREELIKVFSLDRIQSSPAVFDAERLDWMNGLYIRRLSPEELADRAEPFWPAAAATATAVYKKQVLSLVQERLKFLAELSELTEFFFTDPKVEAEVLTKPLGPEATKTNLARLAELLQTSDFTISDLEQRLRADVEQHGLKTGQLFGMIRIAITGRIAAPGLFETLHTLGKDSSLRRLEAALLILT